MRGALSIAIGLSTTLLACGGAPPSPPSSSPASAAPTGPRNPRRATPPPDIASRALAVGATAPAVRLPATTGELDLAAALSRRQRVLLVFYRGDW